MRGLRRRLSRMLYDGRYGVETSDVVRLEDLGLAAEERVDYEPSDWRTLARVLRRRDVSEDDVFLDYGAGMGRILIQAGAYRFKRVIGVELSEQLSQVARRNAEHRSELQDGRLEIVTTDATAYALPDDVTVIFMHSPFKGAIFRSVLERIGESLDRRPRSLRLIYKNPEEHAAVIATGRFEQTGDWRPLRARLRGSDDFGLVRTYETADNRS